MPDARSRPCDPASYLKRKTLRRRQERTRQTQRNRSGPYLCSNAAHAPRTRKNYGGRAGSLLIADRAGADMGREPGRAKPSGCLDLRRYAERFRSYFWTLRCAITADPALARPGWEGAGRPAKKKTAGAMIR